MAKIIVCPECGKDDMVHKVSAIYDSGFVTVQNNSPLVPYGVVDRTLTNITPLAQKLAPPPKPTLSGFATISPVVILIIALVIGLVLFCVLFPSVAWGSGGSGGSGAEYIFECLIFILMMAIIGIPWGIYVAKKQKELQPQIAMWEKAISKWQQLYYCSRNDCVFNPDTGKSVPPNRISALIY